MISMQDVDVPQPSPDVVPQPPPYPPEPRPQELPQERPAQLQLRGNSELLFAFEVPASHVGC